MALQILTTTLVSKMISAKVVSNTSGSVKLSGTPYSALVKMVPSVLNKTVVVEFTNANCAIANAIRRTIISEMPVKHLTVSLTDIKTTDPYIVGEVIKKRLEMIPVAQSISEDAVFSIRFDNPSDTYVDVLSSEIKLNGISESKDIVPFIPICDINAGTSFSVNDIHIKESYGYDNARVSLGKVAYEILDHDMAQPSIASTPTRFRITVETPGIIDPLQTMINAVKNLIERLDIIDFNSSIVEFDVYKLHIQNETHSVGQLMSWYIFKQNPTIKYVADRTIHPSKRECVIDVLHPDGETLCKQAIAEIKADLAKILKTLK